MDVIILQILVILVLILANGFLAMSEIAIVSARKVRLQSRAESGDRRAETALELANQPSRFLSTVQIGISLIGVLAGALGGATIAEEMEAPLMELGLSPQWSEALSVGFVVLVITYLSLVLGELAPKQIALQYPETVSAFVAGPLDLLSRLTSPLVRILSASTNLVLRFIGISPSTEPSITEEEVKMLIDEGTALGVFEPIEDTIVDQVFRLGDRLVTSLVTPRREVAWLDVEDSLDVILETIQQAKFSQYPVARGDLDHLLGFVRASDILSQCLAGQEISLEGILRAPLFVPEHLPAFTVLERFQSSGQEIAFALNEYGGVEGLVTLRDVLEALVGDIPEAEDIEQPEIVQREDGSWLIDGMVTLQEFRDLFDLEILPGESERYYLTLGGFVMNMLGHVPTPGEAFTWQGMRIEVVDMDGNRIDKVLLIPEHEAGGS